MQVDLHNHTTLCNHATGSITEYVENAIKKNINIFGFSDHAPMNFDTKYRMNFDQMRWYENEVKRVKKIYQNRIEILLGYEVDYLPNYIDKRVLDSNVDYLIGSVHFINKWGFDNPEFIGVYKNQSIDKIWEDYFYLIENMAKDNLFDIVGHLDLIKVFKFMPKKDIRLIAKKALRAIKKSGMSIELNGAGLRKPINQIYPSDILLDEIAFMNIPITFGNDAHSVDQVGMFNKELVNKAKSFGYTQCVTYQQRNSKMIKI